MAALTELFQAALQGRSVVQYIASREPVSGSVYLAMLLLFALMPSILRNPMNRTIYFDRNVFDQVDRKRDITDDEIEILRKEISNGKLSILVSFETVIETVNARQDTALSGLLLMKELARQIFPIKSHIDLINDDIRSFASANKLSPPFVEGRFSIDRVIANVQNPSGRLKEEITQEKHNKERLNDKLRKHVEFERKALNGKRPATFDKYWEARARFYGETFAYYAGCLDQCQARDIDELLKVRSVRLTVGGFLSLMYSLLIEGHAVQNGTSYDLMHVAPMSAADIVVTDDRELRRLLVRVPIDDLRVMDLRELIENIR